MTGSILIVDDQPKLRKGLSRDFVDLGYRAYTAANEADALATMSETPIQVILLDVDLGGESGIDVLQRILERHPDASVIMITGFATVATAVEAMKLGALDFVEKPLDFNRLTALVEKACHMAEVSRENKGLRDRISKLTPKIVTGDSVFIAACEQAKRLAATDLPILILGESGTGKELLAEFVHNNSKQRGRDLHQINCAAFPDNLLDDELFGHEKGAFTGADREFPGVFERADGSTLHLDEIGDMALQTQSRILRVLQNREVKRIGGTTTLTVDVRFIASTNRDLKELMDIGSFREDLFFRLNAAVLRVPPLRERMNDVPLLVEHFLGEWAKDHGESPKRMSPTALNGLMNHGWPGNVRELKNCVQYAAAVSGADTTIDQEHLPEDMRLIRSDGVEPISLAENERRLIVKTLRETDNNKKLAADLLGISRNTLYNKLQKYDVT